MNSNNNLFRSLPGLLVVLVLVLAVLSAAVPALAASNPRYASIVMDADTGMILEEQYADKVLHPASLVKMMTLLMTFEALEQGRLRLRDRVPISSRAAKMVPSKLDLPAGSSLRVEDAIYALVTKSANDIAVALAEKIGGTESHFATMMNNKARAIGMSHSYFRNASGLHHPRQVSTARDMAKLARHILKEYPQYYHYFSTQKFTYQGHTYRNHNRLMETYKGMDGFKTGYIHASGFNLVASVKRNNRRLIGVVFGGRTSHSRNAHMAKLLDRGFSRIDDILVASAPVPLPKRKPSQATVALAHAQPQTSPAGVQQLASAANPSYRAELDRILQGRAFSSAIGEGDYDPAVTKRFETGLMAIAAVRGNLPDPGVPSLPKGEWAIQIGAFHSRAKTDQAIWQALETLPPAYKQQAAASIVPLKTNQGWLFRGRLNGFTHKSAIEACRYLPECLPVSPSAY